MLIADQLQAVLAPPELRNRFLRSTVRSWPSVSKWTAAKKRMRGIARKFHLKNFQAHFLGLFLQTNAGKDERDRHYFPS